MLKYELGGAPPGEERQVLVSMRGLYPRYTGPLAQKTVLVLDADELGRTGTPFLATSAGVTTRGDFSQVTEPSASREKEPPLGLRLGSMGRLIKTRFLEVMLRSQFLGKGKATALFPLPTSGDQVSAFFCSAQIHEVEWVVAMCLALNSYWGDLYLMMVR